jgi:hypothetical protein
LTVNFVVCTLAVKEKNQGRFRHVGSDHSLVSLYSDRLRVGWPRSYSRQRQEILLYSAVVRLAPAYYPMATWG